MTISGLHRTWLHFLHRIASKLKVSTEFFMRISIISIMLVSAIFGCEKHLSEGLEEEKSYTRHSMETYRQNPNGFLGNKNVLENWSRSDYIALAVTQQKKLENWAENSDTLNFLESQLRRDTDGSPFCVIQQENKIVVLTIRSSVAPSCSLDLIKGMQIDGIKSGDMEFSGRFDYWVYVFRP
jgi:hypothetical protein